MSLNLAHNSNLESWVWGRIREEYFARWGTSPYIWDCSMEQETVEALVENVRQATKDDPVDVFVPHRRWYQITEKMLEANMKLKFLQSFYTHEDIPFASEDGESLFVVKLREECMKEIQKVLKDEWLVERGTEGKRMYHGTYNPKWFPCMEKMMMGQFWNLQKLSPAYPAWMFYNELLMKYEKLLGDVYQSLLNKYFGR